MKSIRDFLRTSIENTLSGHPTQDFHLSNMINDMEFAICFSSSTKDLGEQDLHYHGTGPRSCETSQVGPCFRRTNKKNILMMNNLWFIVLSFEIQNL